MEGFDKEKGYDDFVKLLETYASVHQTPSGVFKMVRAGQNFLQQIYDRGVSDGLEISTKEIDNSHDNSK